MTVINAVQRTRIRNGSLSEDAAVERWFSEAVCGVRGEHQHYHQEEHGYGALEVHVEVRRLRLFFGLKMYARFNVCNLILILGTCIVINYIIL